MAGRRRLIRLKIELLTVRLAPVTLSPVPAASAVDPLAPHPGAASGRRMLPASGHPDIASAFPTMETGNPDETDSGSGRRSFHDQRRRRCADVNPGPDPAATAGQQQHDSQCESKKKSRTAGHRVLQSPPEELSPSDDPNVRRWPTPPGCVNLKHRPYCDEAQGLKGTTWSRCT